MSLFKDNVLQEKFNDQGFVKIAGFLKEEDVQAILGFIEEKKIRTDVKKMYSNLEDLNMDAAYEVEEKLCSTFKEGITTYFHDYRIAGSSFLFKGTGKDSDSRLHQDWNIVDENQYSSMAIWVPLERVNDENGCLVAVPGSHKWTPSIRSSNYDSIHLKFNKRLDKYIQSIPANAGDAIVYALNTFHGSKSNRSSSTRKSAVVSISDKSAIPVHYFKDEINDRMYAVKGDNAFMYDMYFRLSKGEKISIDRMEIVEEIPDYHKYLVSEADFFGFLNDHPPFLQRLRNRFGI